MTLPIAVRTPAVPGAPAAPADAAGETSTETSAAFESLLLALTGTPVVAMPTAVPTAVSTAGTAQDQAAAIGTAPAGLPAGAPPAVGSAPAAPAAFPVPAPASPLAPGAPNQVVADHPTDPSAVPGEPLWLEVAPGTAGGPLAHEAATSAGDASVPAAPAAPATPVTAPVTAGPAAPAEPTAARAEGAETTSVPAAPDAGPAPALAGEAPVVAEAAPEPAAAPAAVDAPTAQPVTFPAPVAHTSHTAAAEAPARTEPAAAPPPAQQLSAEIVPLRNRDGEHTLTVQLHPVDLGPITVTAQVRGQDIQLDLGGATEAGREALRAALPELRRELERAGFDSCLLNTGTGGARDDHRQTQWLRSALAGAPATGAVTGSDPVAPAPVRSRTAGVLDLHA
ncbi:flagellar hook-length control protein FliK [Actinophytocola sp.]|uniref:flagellar hook-length control protein FliK n=1 Tax=Actinophytocola sp. TaxID=1872138 RepID=UPI002D7E4342|nr:flagellar hook-length control protein FliK [Actinophytocola sp.]HET9143761.1 flagellar hook-length control protein FliK [Actinophytocola sp.]